MNLITKQLLRRSFGSIYGKVKKHRAQIRPEKKIEMDEQSVLPSSDFDLFVEKITPVQTIQAEISRLSKIEFEANNQRVRRAHKIRLQEKIAEIKSTFAQMTTDQLKAFPFPFMSTPNQSLCQDLCQNFQQFDSESRTFFSTDETEFTHASLNCLKKMIEAINNGSIESSRDFIEPLFIRKLRQNLNYLQTNSVRLQLEIQPDQGRFELIGYQNYFLAGIHPNRKKNYPMHFYFEANERALNVEAQLIKKKRQEEKTIGYLVTRALFSSTVPIVCRCTDAKGNLIYEHLSDSSKPNLVMTDFVFAEFDYRQLKKVNNVDAFLAQKTVKEIHEGVKLTDIDGIMQGNPFYKIYDFNRFKNLREESN